MENKNTTAGFVYRNTKEGFIAEGAMIKALYEKMEEILSELHEGYHKPDRALRVFNYAYNICWQITEKPESPLDTRFVDKHGNPHVRTMAYTLAAVLLSIRKQFEGLSKDVKDLLYRHMDHMWAWELQVLTEKYPVEGCLPCPAPATDKPVDFDTINRLTTAALTEGKRLQEENEKLRRELETNAQTHENVVTNWIQRYGHLYHELYTLRQKLESRENNKFYQAVNIDTIVEYAQKQESADLKVIKLMLLDLCADKVDKEVLQKIRRLRSGGNTNINEVGQMYPNATQVTNHYHNHPKDEPND